MRLYAKVKCEKNMYFVKSALTPGDKFYQKEQVTYRWLTKYHIGIQPSLIKSFPPTNIFEFVDGKKLSNLVYNKKFREILNTVVIKIANFHSNSNKREKLNYKYAGFIRKNLLNSIHIGNMHGDLSPSNIIIRPNKEVVIVDWEDFKVNGVCEFDIIHFFVMLGVVWFTKNRKITNRKLAKLILSDIAFGKLVYSLSEQYCNLTNCDKENLIKLLPLYCKSQIIRLEENGRNSINFIYNSIIKEVSNMNTKQIRW